VNDKPAAAPAPAATAAHNVPSPFETVHEIIKQARRNVTPNAWDYLIGGGETETTLRRNRQALDSIALRPRVLRGVGRIDLSTKFLGHKLRIPVMLAPIGSLQSLDPAGGALSAAQGAERFGVVSILSSVTSPGLEEIAEKTRHPKIFQLYVRGDAKWVDDHVKRAIDAGYAAFCFTVDTAIYGRRERDIIKRYRPTARHNLDPAGPAYQAALSWDTIKRYKDKFDLPLAIKGIATAEDANVALEHGVDIIYISNHGGRQLDHGRGCIEVLPEVVEAVGGKAIVLVDGGFYRGSDIVKAMCLGADAVGIGRLYGYGIAAAGADGVARVLEILETELTTDLALLGVTKWSELDRSYLHPAAPTNPAHVFSAFPLLDFGDKGY